MKKVLLSLFLFIGLSCSCNASHMEELLYKNLKDGTKLLTDNAGNWNIAQKKCENCFIKKTPNNVFDFSEYYSIDGEFLFSTGCQYEFIYKGSFIGYSNADLKFYEFYMEDEILKARELAEDEVQEMFKEYKIIKISEFSLNTNSKKVKKGNGKFIILNDTDKYFDNYVFKSNNAKFSLYPISGFIKVTKPGMIQFSQYGGNTKENPWYILLVR